jgi:hypothetical protein
MKVRTLLIVIAVFVIGAGGKFAYDAYREHERQELLESLPPYSSCSTCAAHKADLKRLREYLKEHPLREEPTAPDVE